MGGPMIIRKEWFRFKKLRVLVAWLGVPLLIFFARIDDTSYGWGASLMILGEAIRLWALCFVERKGTKLSMSGPYAFTRNPLYVGNFFLGLGLMVICANWILALIYIIGYTIMYLGTIRSEETELAHRFGKIYAEYCKNVPRLFPRLTPYSPPEKTSFDAKRILKHHEYVTVLGIALLLSCLHIYKEIFVERNPACSQTFWFVVSFVIGLLLVLERLFLSGFKNKFAEGLPDLFHKKDQ